MSKSRNKRKNGRTNKPKTVIAHDENKSINSHFKHSTDELKIEQFRKDIMRDSGLSYSEVVKGTKILQSRGWLNAAGTPTPNFPDEFSAMYTAEPGDERDELKNAVEDLIISSVPIAGMRIT